MPALTPELSLHDLLEEHPFLVDFLPSFNPKYGMLKNPEMRQTAARFATLEMAAGMGGIEVEELIGAIQGEIERQAAREGAPDSRESESPDKKAELKAIIEGLHAGLEPDAAKARFNAVVKDVSPQEIGAMEEELIREGLPVKEIQLLCDLHVSVVQESLERQGEIETPPGHPAHTYRAANTIISEVANHLGELCAVQIEGKGPSDWSSSFTEVLDRISGVHNHYLRKENELFPVLERHGVTGPSKVMWGIHDEIRVQIKLVQNALKESREAASAAGATLARFVVEMAYKENKILIPLALEMLTEEEWADIRRGEDELGYSFVEPAAPFPSPQPPKETSAPNPMSPSAMGSGMSLPVVSAAPTAPLPGPADSYLDLGTGQLTLEQVDMILRHLPVDLSFVDPDGFVRYYSETEERLFPRTPGAIGRHVTNCHPPKSVHMVEEILKSFAAGEREVAEFWIEMGGTFIHIRYFAVRNPEKVYLGCLEVSQDVTAIRALEGERRLLEWS
jgi:DUF438 domain-containing protein